MKDSVFNQFHVHSPKEDLHEICEWIDAGIFSGDLLDTCDLKEFDEYVIRWNNAIRDKDKERIREEFAEHNKNWEK